MKPSPIYFIIILITAFVLTAGLTWAEEECLELSSDIFTSPKRPPVCFNHDPHNETAGLEDDCAVCHHFYEDGKLMEGESSEDSTCAECHFDQDNPKLLNLTVKYHARCRGCHLTEKKGPITCGECHAKSKNK